MDFRGYIAKAEESLSEIRAELELSIKKAKEAEVAFLDKKAELKAREDKVKAHEKEIDAKIAKLANLEKIDRDEQKIVAREVEIERKEREAKKAIEEAATLKLQAEQALQSAKDVKDKVNKEKAEMEGRLLDKFKKIVMEG